jgi:hypothetical protein
MKMDVSLAYKKKPQAELLSFASTVWQKMRDDDQFKHLVAEITILGTKTAAFAAAIAAAQGGSDAQKAAKRVCWDETLEALDILAFLVNIFAKGDELTIKAAGFEVKKAAKSLSEVPMPTDLQVVNEPRTGEISTKWKGCTAAVNYGLRFRVEGETAYQNGTYATACYATIMGLPSKTYVEVCVQAMGTKSLKSEWTEPVSVLVS